MIKNIALLGMLLSVGVSYGAEGRKKGGMNYNITPDGLMTGKGCLLMRNIFNKDQGSWLLPCTATFSIEDVTLFLQNAVIDTAPPTIFEGNHLYINTAHRENGEPFLTAHTVSPGGEIVAWEAFPPGSKLEKVMYGKKGGRGFSITSSTPITTSLHQALAMIAAKGARMPLENTRVSLEGSLDTYRVEATVTVDKDGRKKTRRVRFYAEPVSDSDESDDESRDLVLV